MGYIRISARENFQLVVSKPSRWQPYLRFHFQLHYPVFSANTCTSSETSAVILHEALTLNLEQSFKWKLYYETEKKIAIV